MPACSGPHLWVPHFVRDHAGLRRLDVRAPWDAPRRRPDAVVCRGGVPGQSTRQPDRRGSLLPPSALASRWSGARTGRMLHRGPGGVSMPRGLPDAMARREDPGRSCSACHRSAAAQHDRRRCLRAHVPLGGRAAASPSAERVAAQGPPRRAPAARSDAARGRLRGRRGASADSSARVAQLGAPRARPLRGRRGRPRPLRRARHGRGGPAQPDERAAARRAALAPLGGGRLPPLTRALRAAAQGGAPGRGHRQRELRHPRQRPVQQVGGLRRPRAGARALGAGAVRRAAQDAPRRLVGRPAAHRHALARVARGRAVRHAAHGHHDRRRHRARASHRLEGARRHARRGTAPRPRWPARAALRPAVRLQVRSPSRVASGQRATCGLAPAPKPSASP